MTVTAVVLAAGSSTRMGANKLLMSFDGAPMIDRVLEACREYDTVVVASAEAANHVRATSGALAIENAQPERGMAHSLALANDAIPSDRALLVFLADKPLVTPDIARRVVQAASASQADVCYPERNGVGGHPVFFSPRARQKIAGLEGDSLQRLRDDPQLIRKTLASDDEGAYFDVDTPAQMPSGALRRPHGE